MSNPDLQPHVGAAHSILGLLSSIAIGCNKLHSLQQSNSNDTTDQSSKTHRSQLLHTQVPKLTGRRPCTHRFMSTHACELKGTAAAVSDSRPSGGGGGRGGPRPECLVVQLAGSCSIILKLLPTYNTTGELNSQRYQHEAPMTFF